MSFEYAIVLLCNLAQKNQLLSVHGFQDLILLAQSPTHYSIQHKALAHQAGHHICHVHSHPWLLLLTSFPLFMSVQHIFGNSARVLPLAFPNLVTQ